ncbi:hypothetical protein DKX38_007048 [Salix brachista]|uniref:Uncharacterized protein n=1 Tax=Salix brachista TaxID=2182728 RepID=A0A5N5MM49_9ROSI|nr:hypothetical protein DKX38_007048 [Salix brachista]
MHAEDNSVYKRACFCSLSSRRSVIKNEAIIAGVDAAHGFGLRQRQVPLLFAGREKWVACDNTTNRVIELDLAYVNYDAFVAYDAFVNYDADLYLNASLFLPFKELETLYLSNNQLVGGLKNQGSLLSILFSLHIN